MIFMMMMMMMIFEHVLNFLFSLNFISFHNFEDYFHDET
jgi:hypothetical protein